MRTWVANIVINISHNIGAGHTGALSNLGIPLAASASAGFALGWCADSEFSEIIRALNEAKRYK